MVTIAGAMEKPPGEQGLRVITDTMPVAAVRCDRESRFLWVNPTYAKWAGRPARDIIGLRIIDIMGSRAMNRWPTSAWSSCRGSAAAG